jgi:tRNA1Val (adenine37-N6)-methyltransferase
MKVGTDGVLLGSWADCADSWDILDVGTGSGLIALMLAQRSKAYITALDLDENACSQAISNVSNSCFYDRISIIHSSFQEYRTDKKYDLIVSNPPYFEQSLKSHDKQRNLARHNNALPFEDLLNKSASLLTDKGKFALVLPFDVFSQFDDLAGRAGLYLNKRINVHSTPVLPPKRILLEYSFFRSVVLKRNLIIEISRHIYHEDYINLTKDFYLKMN